MNVLILGGTGVISTSVVKLCVENGYKVSCVNRGRRKNDNSSLDVTVYNCNVSDGETLRDMLAGNMYDAVVDFLCYSAEALQSHMKTLKGLVRQYVLISTDSVYKVKKDGDTYQENDELGNSIWRYSTGKVACEEFIKEHHEEYGMKYTIVRPAVTFGNTRIPYGLMPKEGYHYYLIDRIRSGKYIPVWNEGKNISTIIRSEDFARFFVPLLGNEQAYSQTFNVSGDEYVTNSDVLRWVSDYVGKDVKTVDVSVESITKVFKDKIGEFAVDRAYDHKVSNAKIKSLTGISCSMTVREGIEKSIFYYEENNYCSGIDYFFDGQLDRLINDSKKADAKQKFINYRPAESVANHIEYLKGYYCNSIAIRCFFAVKNFLGKVRAKLRYYMIGHY